MQFGQPVNLNWLWWLFFVALGGVIAILRQRAARKAFASPELLRRMAPTGMTPRVRSLALSTLALMGMVLGLVDIRWGRIWREVPQRGIEVMFVLDVSRSMLARDVSPNRLERSKQYIKDMIQEMGGDRVGLVLFAGDVKKQIPLTNHYADYAESLDEIGPQHIDRGGSNLAQAIEVAAESFLDKTSDHRAIVLFTDGEYHEQEPVELAKRAYEEQGTRIFTVGIGDSDAGARIPAPNRQRGPGETYLQYEGETVMSRQNSDVLEQIALNTDGAYIPAGTKHVDMATVYHRFVANIEERDFDTARINAFVPRYPWFLGFSLLVLVVDALLASRESSTLADRGEDEGDWNHGIAQSLAAGIAVCFVLSVGSLVMAQDNVNADSKPQVTAEQLVQQGQAALRQGDAVTALERFGAAEAKGFQDARLSYNKGIAHYNQGEMQAAREAFAVASASNDPRVAGNAQFNLGNTLYTEALRQMEQDPVLAMTSLQQAIDHYRGALACNASDRDARANIELADRLRRQLKQRQEQQPQEQQRQENQSDENQSEQSQNESQQSSSNEQNQEQDQRGEQDQNKQSDQSDSQEQDSQSSTDSGENRGFRVRSE